MNDQRYGLIRDIQDALYDGRHTYTELHILDYTHLAESMCICHSLVSDLTDFGATLESTYSQPGPSLLEMNMIAMGTFSSQFTGLANSETKALKTTA